VKYIFFGFLGLIALAVGQVVTVLCGGEELMIASLHED
jgi:hypothetical protein